MIVASFPTAPAEWQIFNIGEILRSWGATWAKFDLPIHSYALCILVGIIVGLAITNRRLVARGVEPWLVLDVSLLAIPLGIIGGRAYHVLTHPKDYFAGQDPMHILYVWEGGMAIFGALILGAVGALQFDVVAHRLEHEYGVQVIFESYNCSTARCRPNWRCPPCRRR